MSHIVCRMKLNDTIRIMFDKHSPEFGYCLFERILCDDKWCAREYFDE